MVQEVPLVVDWKVLRLPEVPDHAIDEAIIVLPANT